jgi:hypothetical protein
LPLEFEHAQAPRKRGPASGPGKKNKENVMSLGTILLIVVILILVGVLPTWPHARNWGYGPSGILGVILVILIVLFLMGRL